MAAEEDRDRAGFKPVFILSCLGDPSVSWFPQREVIQLPHRTLIIICENQMRKSILKNTSWARLIKSAQ